MAKTGKALPSQWGRQTRNKKTSGTRRLVLGGDTGSEGDKEGMGSEVLPHEGSRLSLDLGD